MVELQSDQKGCLLVIVPTPIFHCHTHMPIQEDEISESHLFTTCVKHPRSTGPFFSQDPKPFLFSSGNFETETSRLRASFFRV